MDDQRGTQGAEQALRAIFDGECDEFAETLYLAAQAERKGAPDQQRFADFFAHRAICRRCQETFADVKRMLDWEADAAATAVQPLPGSSLPAGEELSAPAPRSGVLAQGREWLVETTRQGAQLVIDLSLVLWQDERPALALRQREDEQPPLGGLTVTPAPAQLGYSVEVRLRLLPDAADPELAVLAAEISLPDRWPDFSGVAVLLHLPNGESRRAATGPTGIVRFPGLARRDLAAVRCVVELM